MAKHGRQGEGGGQPPKYKSAEELHRAAESYFLQVGFVPNKAGLCLHLLISKDTYNEYRKKFPAAIKGFDNLIENWWVARLAGTTPTGAIFYLKNAFKEDYRDRNETELSGNLTFSLRQLGKRAQQLEHEK